jgi:hypothetical protein
MKAENLEATPKKIFDQLNIKLLKEDPELQFTLR